MDSTLQTKPVFTSSKVEPKRLVLRQHRFTIWTGLALTAIILAVGFLCARIVFVQRPSRNIVATPPLVVVSPPLQRDVGGRLQFLGQFSAVDHLELRAQVGGTLTKIGFKDGDIVHPGDLLFVIDPTPYRIRLSEATAQLESARARLDLAKRELVRADSLKKSGADTIENFDQKAAE